MRSPIGLRQRDSHLAVLLPWRDNRLNRGVVVRRVFPPIELSLPGLAAVHDEGWGQATGNAYCVASTQEGGMIHAAMAAPASMPNANTMIAIISLAVRLSTDRVSSSSAVGGRSIMGATIASCLITFPSFRPSCHSEIPQETIARTIEVLRKHGVCSVGGTYSAGVANQPHAPR